MKREPWKVLHLFLIGNFLMEILYGIYMVFFVAGGGKKPLFRRASEIPIDVMTRRRLYAIETWVAICGLSIYLGITEILPRKLSHWRKRHY